MIKPSSGREPQRENVAIGHIAKLLHGNDLTNRIEESITNAVTDTLEGYNPNYVKGFNSWNAYSRSIQFTRDALREYGFVFDATSNQGRLLSSDFFSVPVILRFARGRLAGGVVLFNSKKGIETFKGVEQNRQHFRNQVLLLKPQVVFPDLSKQELNLWIIYDFTQEWLNVWLAMGTEPKTSSMMFCDEHMVVCSKSLVLQNTPRDISRPEPTTIDVLFGERNTDAG